MRSISAIVVGSFLTVSSQVFAEPTASLYGAAHQGPDGPSTLYTINPNTGLAAPIGPIGFERVSGMDFHPETGTLYASAQRADGSNTGVLIIIDPLIGVGAEVGPFVAGGAAVGLSFRSDGTLFGYGFGFQTATINTVTGEATLLGQDPSFLDARGFGTAFSPTDVLYTALTFFGDVGLSDDVYTLSTLDQTMGSELTATSLTYSQPVDNLPRINAMDFHPGTGVVFASINDGVRGRGPNYLGIVNPITGVVSVSGRTVDGLDAIAFTLDSEPRVPETRGQQACINRLNVDFAKVAKAKDKAIRKCLKKKVRRGESAAACLALPNRRVERAREKTLRDADRWCGDVPPDFGPLDADAVNEAAVQAELATVLALFGANLDAALVTRADGKSAAKCQQAVLKAVQKCQRTRIKVFNRCKRRGLKNGSIQRLGDFRGCMRGDPKGRIAKACDAETGRLAKRILPKICVAKGVDLSPAFPGCGAADPNELASCLDAAVACRVCLGLNEADGLGEDCDLFDDGVANASCIMIMAPDCPEPQACNPPGGPGGGPGGGP